MADGVLDSLAQGQKLIQSYDITVDDENDGGTAVQTVTITITGTNDAPVIDAAASTVSGGVTERADKATDENTALHTAKGAVVFTDVDLTDTHTAGVVAQGTEYLGEFSLDTSAISSGSVGWSFAVADGVLDSLAQGQKLIQSYDITVDDENDGGTAVQTVTITITGTNDAPVATGETFTGKEDTTVFGNVLGNDTDVDGDDLEVVLTSGPSEDFVENFELRPDGTFTLTPKANVNDNTSGASFSFTYKVVDGKGGVSEVVKATVNITPENDAPEVIRSTDPDYAEYGRSFPQAFQEVREGGANPEGISLSTSGSFHVRDIDSFAQDGDGIRTDLVSIGSEPVKTVFLPANDGAKAPDISEFVQIQNLSIQTADPGATVALVTYTFKVNDSALDFLGEGDKITLDYVVTIRDGHPTDEKFVTETVTLEIFGSDDKAVLTVVNPGDVQEADVASAQLITASGSITVDDVDQNDEISTLVQRKAGSASYEGPDGPGVPANVISDEDLAILTNWENLKFKDTGLVTNGAGKTVSLSFDYEAPSGVNLDALPAGGSLTLTFEVEVTVGFDDLGPVKQTKDVTITIQGTNDAPVVSDITVGDKTNVDAGANASVQDNGNVYEDGGVGPVGTDDMGQQEVEVTGYALVDASASDVDDGDQLFVSGIKKDGISLNVTSAETTIAGTYGALMIAANGKYTYSLYQNGHSEYGALNALGHNQPAEETFIFTVSDGNGGTADANLTFTVIGSNDRPVVKPVADVVVDEGSAPGIVQAKGLVTASDVDDGDKIDFKFTVTGLTPNGEQMEDDEKNALLKKIIDTGAFKGVSDGNWSFELPSADVEFLNAGSSLAIEIKVEANDGQVQANSVGESSFTITINGENDAPTVSPIELNNLGEAALNPPVMFNLIEEGGASDLDGDTVTLAKETVGGIEKVTMNGNAFIKLSDITGEETVGDGSIDLQIPIETLIGAGVITVDPDGSFTIASEVASVLQDLLGNGDAMELAGTFGVTDGTATTPGSFDIEILGEGGAETHTAYTDDGGANIPDFLSPNELSDNDGGVAG
ncbi:VCBS domain-containing protein [Limimaricola sp. AA108-03]|uniref:VCBS domain-containing protein n=1 Tax=Limimaricola sp. AA108-03 TaxID=3425945 RepID=UPI003D76B6DB